MVSSGGKAPVMAIIEEISAAECRMRSVNFFASGADVEFSVVLHGSAPIPLRGTIASATRNGSRLAYVVVLESTVREAYAIARAVGIARARSQPHAPEVHTGNGLTRSSVRVPVDFAFHYAQAGSEGVARATNLSTGGLLMNSHERLAVGAALELRLPLGQEMTRLHGRIVAHQADTTSYNLAFYDISNAARDALARYVDAHLTNK